MLKKDVISTAKIRVLWRKREVVQSYSLGSVTRTHNPACSHAILYPALEMVHISVFEFLSRNSPLKFSASRIPPNLCWLAYYLTKGFVKKYQIPPCDRSVSANGDSSPNSLHHFFTYINFTRWLWAHLLGDPFPVVEILVLCQISLLWAIVHRLFSLTVSFDLNQQVVFSWSPIRR